MATILKDNFINLLEEIRDAASYPKLKKEISQAIQVLNKMNIEDKPEEKERVKAFLVKKVFTDAFFARYPQLVIPAIAYFENFLRKVETAPSLYSEVNSRSHKHL